MSKKNCRQTKPEDGKMFEDFWNHIDLNIRGLVLMMNLLRGIDTRSSCGGHENPTGAQHKAGTWFVCFLAFENRGGLESLEVIRKCCEGILGARPDLPQNALEIQSKAPIYWIHGRGGEPILLAKALCEIVMSEPQCTDHPAPLVKHLCEIVMSDVISKPL